MVFPRLLREVPRSVFWEQNIGTAIKYDRVTAEQWPVIYILRPTLVMPADAMYIRNNDEVFFISRTDEYTYDLMDALDIPHLHGDDITASIRLVRPQSICNHNGSYTTWVINSSKHDTTMPRSPWGV